jgi:subtilisin
VSIPDEELPAWSRRRGELEVESLPSDWPHRIEREWAWGGSDGSGATVAIVDSGIDGTHELVGGVSRSVMVERDEDGEVTIVEDTRGDVAGHGTACAGIVRSIAPAAELWSVRVLGPEAKGGGLSLLTGLKWAVDQGASVVNLSLSTRKRETAALLYEVADDAYFGGTIVVASAHNLDILSYPWRFASVVSVASHDGTDPLEFHYNPHPPVEIFARGMDLEVAWLGGSKILAAGNSFATAHISGICALILAKHPQLTPPAVKTILRETASNMETR